MGQAIVYCVKCQNRLRSSDAVQFKGQSYCTPCGKDLVSEAPSKPPSKPPVGTTSERGFRLSGSTPHAPSSLPPAPAPSRTLLILAALGVVAVLAAAIAVVTRSSTPPPESVTRPPEPEPLPRPPKREEHAKELPPPPKLREEPRPVENPLAGLVPLDATVRAASDAEDFPKAFALLDEARTSRSEPGWAAAVEQRIAALRDSADRLYGSVKEKALEARRRGAEPEVQGFRDRVTRWGIAALAADLEKALAEAAAPTKAAPPPTEAQAYRTAWFAAIETASARDYAAAIRELERLAQGLQDAALKAEAAADLQSLRSLQSAVDESIKAVVRTPKGQKLAVVYTDESGTPQRREGTVLRADVQRIDLKSGEETVAVLPGEILSETVAARLPKRLGALLCAIERGPVEASSGLPERFLGRPDDPDAAKREAAARQLFWAAEREYAIPATTVDAVQKFAALLKTHEGTAFVRRNRASIQPRAEGGREYFFFADLLKGGGAFRMAKHSKLGPCWVSGGEAQAGSLKDNFVELEFSVLPQTEYRCWAYLGGCCTEALAGAVLASEAAEPAALSHSISFAARKHSAHGGPKEATRWAWVSIPLPKFGAPGNKTVRLLTESAGFSVAYAFVSSAKAQPPTESEVRERERSRPPVPAVAPLAELRSVSDEALVFHWTFDQGSGTAAADASKHNHHGDVVGAPAWVTGRAGKALQFDGAKDYVRAHHPMFTVKTRELSLAAWIFRKAEGSAAQAIVNRQRGGYINDQYSLTLASGAPLAMVYTSGGLRTAKGAAIPLQQWVHLAGVFDGTALKLYVNGAEAASDAGPSGSDYVPEDKPITVGAGINDDSDRPTEYFPGLIDEARLYHRALTPAEVAALAGVRR